MSEDTADAVLAAPATDTVPAPDAVDHAPVAADAAAPALPPKKKKKGRPRKRAAGGGPTREDCKGGELLDIRGPISNLALRIGAALAEAQKCAPCIFLRSDGEVVFVDHARGVVEVINPVSFPALIEGFMDFVRGDALCSLSSEQAAKILVSRQFRSYLPPLRGVEYLRLPDWATPEKNSIRWLPVGYDRPSGVYTMPRLEFSLDGDPDEALAYFKNQLRQFPFKGKSVAAETQGFAVVMGGQLSVFTHRMLQQGPRPPFIFLASQSGSGKSLLAKLALAPVHGSPTVKTLPKDEKELSQVLFVASQEGDPYLYFDNVKGRISSPALEGFLTARQWGGRILGKSVSGSAPNEVLMFMSGNSVTFSPDIARRALICELHSAREVAGRKFDRVITESWLFSDAARVEMLGHLAALVKFWSNLGCPRSTRHIMPSFEEFSAIIGGLCEALKLADPCAPSAAVLDETTAAWKLLLASLADGVSDGGSAEFSLDDILESAKELDVTEVILPGQGEPRRLLGHRIKPWRGRELQDSTGRWFSFDRHRSGGGQRYVVTILPTTQTQTP